eukprot:15111360-Alexandrium_andersonii.AAC.1
MLRQAELQGPLPRLRRQALHRPLPVLHRPPGRHHRVREVHYPVPEHLHPVPVLHYPPRPRWPRRHHHFFCPAS